MQYLKTIAFFICVLLAIHTQAQNALTYDEVNTKSYALYEKGSWKELLVYGKDAIGQGQDFALLRLRLGYASYMLNNFSEAINQYQQVLKNDSYNSTAHYYIYLCRKYLNQADLGEQHLKYFSKEDIAKEKITKIGITGVGFEASFKSTDNNLRGNTNYEKLVLKNRFAWNIHMQQAAALFNQNILLANTPQPRPPFLPPLPITYRTTAITQAEYYNKITANINNHWQIKGAYHYTNTQIDNITFNNQTAFFAVKYYSHYFDVQASANFSTISDSSISQYDVQLGLYPLGNLKLYSFSTGIIRNRPSGSAFNFRQILGVQVAKKIWLESNVTLGSFTDLFEKDALYIYNQIDKNLFKAGIIAYASISPKCIFELGYTLEQRELFKTTITFNQHSITGGLSWKF